MLTAESFHGTLCGMARRNGLFTKIAPNPVTYELVQDLEGEALERRWKQWARQETFRRCVPDTSPTDDRINVGLTIHGAELSMFSSMVQQVSVPISPEDGFSDALFEAEDAHSWRALLAGGSRTVRSHELSLPAAMLAQAVVQVHKHRELEQDFPGEQLPFCKHRSFYNHMMSLADDIDIDPLSGERTNLTTMWHYVFVVRLAPIGRIEEAAGRTGTPSHECIAEVQQWVGTPAARLAALHCGHILHYAEDIRDQAFLLPR